MTDELIVYTNLQPRGRIPISMLEATGASYRPGPIDVASMKAPVPAALAAADPEKD